MHTRALVLELFRSDDHVMLKLALLEGDLQAGMRLSSQSGDEVEILGVAFSPPHLWLAGIRLASVLLLSGKCPEANVTLEHLSD